VPLAEPRIAHPETFSRREADYPDLALVEVTVDVESGLRGAF
jgi:hypothetical protein